MARPERQTVLDVGETEPGGPDPTPESKGSASAFLVVIYGAELGKRVSLAADTVTCGRETECDLQIDDERVSRRHAQILWTGRSHVIEDLGSTNGTFVNNAAVDARPLNPGDQVKIGRTIYKYLIGGTAEAQYHAVIYQLMTNDGLTTALNKRTFEETFQREISRASRYRRPLALLLFDIDHFKAINDDHGHMAGDEVLRQLGALVQQNIRREDVFGRVGGEEFALLVPEGNVEGSRLFAERLRQVIEGASFHFEGTTIRVTCSFGLATLGDDDSDDPVTAMTKDADRRLYAAKSGGRNRVVCEG